MRRFLTLYSPVGGAPDHHLNSEESFIDPVQPGQGNQHNGQNGERQMTLPQPVLNNRVTMNPTQPNQPDALARPATAAVGNVPIQDDIFDSRILGQGEQANSSFNFSFESDRDGNAQNASPASRPVPNNEAPRAAAGSPTSLRNFETAPRAQQAL